MQISMVSSDRRTREIAAGLRLHALTTGLGARTSERPVTSVTSRRSANQTVSASLAGETREDARRARSPGRAPVAPTRTTTSPSSARLATVGSTRVPTQWNSTRRGGFVGLTPTTIVATIGTLPKEWPNAPFERNRSTSGTKTAGLRHLARNQPWPCGKGSPFLNLKVPHRGGTADGQHTGSTATTVVLPQIGLGAALGAGIAMAADGPATERILSASRSSNPESTVPWRSTLAARQIDLGLAVPKTQSKNHLPLPVRRRRRKARNLLLKQKKARRKRVMAAYLTHQKK